MATQSETRPLGAAGLGKSPFLAGDTRENSPSGASAQAEKPTTSRAERERAALAARCPDAFSHGYLGARTGIDQPETDAGGYPRGFHQWPLEKRDAWWAGANLGRVERECGQ